MKSRLIIILALLFSQVSAADRMITFVNHCAFPVWFGFAGGSAINVNKTSTLCNSNSDCQLGTSCVKTGSISQCFWNNPAPVDKKYELSVNGGSNSVSIPQYKNGIIWSGAVAGRTGCGNGPCETAACSDDALACNPSRGFNQPATQAEFTFNSDFSDFYDVEVINGISIPVSMSPTNGASNSYNCGSPGAIVPSSSQGACSWNFTPPLNDYVWVQNGGISCSTDETCTKPNEQCGLSFNPGHQHLMQKTCGKRLGYWTANQVCGNDSNYGVPFYCNQNLETPQQQYTMKNLYACAPIGSCYQDKALNDCCGCVEWQTVGIKIIPAGEPCKNINSFWVKTVQPTLQWIKKGCSTLYTYPYDDPSSTFTCMQPKGNIKNNTDYTITFCPVGKF